MKFLYVQCSLDICSRQVCLESLKVLAQPKWNKISPEVDGVHVRTCLLEVDHIIGWTA